MSNNDYTFKKTQRSGSHNHYSGGVLETVRESPQETDFSQSQTSSEFIRSPGPSLFSVPYFAAYQNPSPNLPKNSLNTVEGQQLCSLDPHSHFSWADLFIPLPTEERGRFGSLGTSKRSWDDEEIDILSLGQPTQPTSRSDLILSAFSRNQPPFYQTITGSKSSLVPPSPKHPEFTLVEDGICFGPGKSVSYPPYEIKQPYPMFEFDPKPNHSAVLSPKSHLLKGTPEHQCMPDGEALFGKFLPLLKIVTKDNFEIFLVQVLKECRHVPMEDFYNLLYNETYSEAVPNVREQASGRSREAGLALCHLVLETFKTSKLPACAIQKGDSNNTSLSSINFHEFLRTFLAIKIISDMLEETEYTYPGTDSVSRVCVYKVYYIFCQKLISTYPTLSTSLSVQQNIILGQPSLGRLTRSIFPDLNIKRLGRRGESLPHYIGLRWNKAAVNDETLEMSDLAVPQIQDIFKDSRRKCRNKLAQSTVSAFHSQTQKNKRKEQPKYNKEGPSANRSFTQVYPNPVNSFVDFSCKYLLPIVRPGFG
ncbi:hypothetical protein JCM33374_g5047 [Metschnikowia sp. JCM 33374]|nr:hypothetical protein JCM33374_g5047 [Metschnikowia sp. JCM 33374]